MKKKNGKAPEIIKLAEEEAKDIKRWWRDYFRIPPNDPRFQRIPMDQILLDYYSHLFLEGAKYCPQCGRFFYGNYCPFCGAFYGEKKKSRCPNPSCRTEGPPEWKYCPNCGSKIEIEEVKFDLGREDMEWLMSDEEEESPPDFEDENEWEEVKDA